MPRPGRDDRGILWTPPPDVRQTTEIGRYLAWLERGRGLAFTDYDALWRLSVDDLAGFWSSIWEFFEVKAHAPYSTVLASDALPGATWFPGARLNFAEHLIGRCCGRTGSLISSESPITSLSCSSSELVPSTTTTGDFLALSLARISRLSVNRVVETTTSAPSTRGQCPSATSGQSVRSWYSGDCGSGRNRRRNHGARAVAAVGPPHMATS